MGLLKLSGGFKSHFILCGLQLSLNPGTAISALFPFVVVQGHHLPPPRGTSPWKLIPELLLALGLQHLRVLEMRAGYRLPRTKVQPDLVRILVDTSFCSLSSLFVLIG